MMATMVAAVGTMAANQAQAQAKYDEGANDFEIRIGNKTVAAYFTKINAEGGINGRKIKFISVDDSNDPRKTPEAIRKVVEEERVLFIGAPFGSSPNATVQKYLNDKKIPQLFVMSGTSRWDHPDTFPWSMGWQPSYEAEAHIYAQYLLENHPQGKIGILYQNDELGQSYLKGMKEALAGKMQIVAEAPYDVRAEPNVDAQMIKLKASGADILFNGSVAKVPLAAIRKAAALGWKPLHILSSNAYIKPVGEEGAEGLLSATYLKDTTDPAWLDDPARREYLAFMDQYMPEADKNDVLITYAYGHAQSIVQVLKQCGDDLTRANVMRQAASLKGLQLPMLLPGIMINTSASDHAPLEQMQMMRFSGGRWERFGPVRSGIDPGSLSESFKTIFQYGTAKRDLANKLNANTVSLMTGSFGSTYAQIGADMSSIIDNGENLRLLPVLGRGSVQAVADILLLRGVDAGIVRKDTLAYLERKDFANNIRNQFVYVTKMFNEEMHVLAPKTVRSLKELDGKTVVVDLPDSSTFVTSINVFERLGIKPHLVYIEPRLALEMLRKGDIDAIVAVEGKPLQWLSQIRDTNLHLVPVEYEKPIQGEYLPSKLSSEDYPNLISDAAPVDTIAAEAVLASYNWPPNSDRYRRLSLLVESLFTRVAQLQRPPFHPKWKEMAVKAPVAGWTRFQAAQEWINRNIPSVETVAASTAVEPASAGKPINRDDPLFREFLQWRASRTNAKR
jgi:branched-chain amino acid transport system substrate-binding protein